MTTLAEVFTALLGASQDGDVVKFAGDALLLAYDGADHAGRACHAAWSMQRVLDKVGRVRLAGARETLRMSAGVHTGRFHLFLTSGDHEFLVVHGPDMDRLLALEAVRGKRGGPSSADATAALSARRARSATGATAPCS